MARKISDVRDIAKEMDLMKMLQCPACKDVALPPIYTCTEGHIICSECLTMVQRCPVCQKSFSNTRNYNLETVFVSSTFTCKFKDSGCDKLLKGTALPIHMRKCEYRPTKCSFKDCSENIPAMVYMEHLKSVHNIFGYDNEQDSYEFKNANDFVLSDKEIDLGLEYVYFDSHYFLVHLVIREKIVYQNICVVGPESAAEKYTATFTFINKAKKVPAIQWAVPVQSFRNNPEWAWDNCVAIPVRQLKFFMKNDSTANSNDSRNYKFVWETKCQIVKTSEEVSTDL